MEIEYIMMRKESGNTIYKVSKDALILSLTHGVPAHFEFNGTTVVVDSTEFLRQIVARWEADRDPPL